MPTRVFLRSPYRTGSHAIRAESYVKHNRHEVRLFTIPSRFWKWRMQGGVLELVERLRWATTRPAIVRATDPRSLARSYTWEQLAPVHDRTLTDLNE